jgi:hypothetical protein
LGFVGVRVLEASTIFLCVVSLLSVVTLRQAGVGADGLLARRRWSLSMTGSSSLDKASFRP